VGIDPRAAATVWPWWGGDGPTALTDDGMIAGANMPGYLQNADWSTYGQSFTVVGTLEPSGTLLDDTMLMTTDAARRIARARAAKQQQGGAESGASTAARAPTLIADPGDGVSAILVLAAPGVDPAALAPELARLGDKVDATPAPAFVTALRGQVRAFARVVAIGAVASFAVAAGLLILGLLPRGALRASRDAAVGREEPQRA
jgi:hypothetical protein